MLDLLIDADCPGIISNGSVTDPGLSDHFLVISNINVGRPKPQLQRYSFRDFRSMDPDDFAAQLLKTDAYVNPADDVDSFYN